MLDLLKDIDLPEQFKDETVKGRILIYDADPLAYRSSAKVAKLKTAVSRFQVGVLEMIFLTKSESARVHLTHKDCLKAGRGNIIGVKPYQGQRIGANRPPLLHELRDAAVEDENVLRDYSAYLHMNVEADDVCTIDSYRYKQDAVLMSEDKDLRQTPYPFYDHYLDKVIQAKGVGSLWENVTEAGNMSVHGIGRLFFWAQMLMGDQADNVGALQYYEGKRIGGVRTLDILTKFNDTEDESEVANLVVDAYREIDQNPYPEGYLLHMMRAWGDSFHNVVMELDWSKTNKTFLEDCATRKWFK